MGRYFITSEENIEYLAHYGVKGMKWKNRKRRPVNESANHKTLQDIIDKLSDDFTMTKANAKKYIKERRPVNESANHKTLKDIVDKASDDFTMAKANAKKYIKEKLYNGGEPVNEIKRRAQKAATTAGVVAVGAVGNAVDKIKDIAKNVKKKRKKKK